eukprot:CAMPEP_0197031962 /NCGR_PEP_ID=MMETSP1384-20130603/10767_1 /TAXON_ID=29189 /ORGANISM="Ammonia sp." /LENGTH=213 /DNA_ID=CAMNT_0042461549 /DNA_START=11 /DNA_END=652 /DNA_ORIENTATION=+
MAGHDIILSFCDFLPGGYVLLSEYRQQSLFHIESVIDASEQEGQTTPLASTDTGADHEHMDHNGVQLSAASPLPNSTRAEMVSDSQCTDDVVTESNTDPHSEIIDTDSEPSNIQITATATPSAQSEPNSHVIATPIHIAEEQEEDGMLSLLPTYSLDEWEDDDTAENDGETSGPDDETTDDESFDDNNEDRTANLLIPRNDNIDAVFVSDRMC